MAYFLSKKVCPICSDEFRPDRSNQVYCSRAHQVIANNVRAKNLRDGFKEINAKLRRNWKTLKALYHENSDKVYTRHELGRLGVDLVYHTHDVVDDGGKSHNVIYGFILFRLENEQFKIIEK